MANLTSNQSIALSQEIDEFTSILRYGLAYMERGKININEHTPILVLFSIGCEKFIKTTLGLIRLEQEGSWPSKVVMKSDYGHKISIIDTMAQDFFQSRNHLSTAPGYMDELRERVDRSLVIQPMMQVLDRYANAGRFYNLDDLSDARQQAVPPIELWQQVQRQAIKSGKLEAGLYEVSSFEDAYSQMHHHIAAEMRQWHEYYRRAWSTGICGNTGKAWAGTLDLKLV